MLMLIFSFKKNYTEEEKKRHTKKSHISERVCKKLKSGEKDFKFHVQIKKSFVFITGLSFCRIKTVILLSEMEC